MTSRILPPAEWPCLAGTEAEKLWPLLDARRSAVVVVEDGTQIVGCHVILWVPHVECLWIHPDHRGKSSVGRRLWGAVTKALQSMGVHGVVTGCDSDAVRGLLEHVGATKIPAEHYVVPVPPLGDEARGEAFHAQLFKLMPQAEHADDPDHHRAVGGALRQALSGNPALATEQYNLWANSHGYAPVTFLGLDADGALVADIVEAIIAVEPSGRVLLLEERCL